MSSPKTNYSSNAVNVFECNFNSNKNISLKNKFNLKEEILHKKNFKVKFTFKLNYLYRIWVISYKWEHI